MRYWEGFATGIAILTGFLLLVYWQFPPENAPETLEKQHNEPYYTQKIASERGWKAEVKTSVGTRCDLVSEEYAIEVEWPEKPYEAVGQSLHYAIELGKKPAIMFLVSEESQVQFVESRIGKVSRQANIALMWYDLN